MLAQSDMEQELYEGRLKAKRNLQTLETERRIAEDQRRTAEEQRAEWQQRCEAANREREAANRREEAAKKLVVRQIPLVERLPARQLSNADQLTAYSLDDLRDLAERLERELGR
jgi:hypothetical protein